MKNTITAARGRRAAFPGGRVLVAALAVAALGITGCRPATPETSPTETSAIPQQPGDGGLVPVEDPVIVPGGTSGGAADTDDTATDDGSGATTGGLPTGSGDDSDTATGDIPAGGTTTDDTATDDGSGATTGGLPTGSGDDSDTATGDIPAGGTTTDDTPQPPPPTAGSLTLNWRAPTERESGVPLSPAEMGGYRIYYGPVSNPKANVIALEDPMLTAYVIGGLPTGTWQVAVSALDSDGTESSLSNALSKTIP